MAEEKTFFNHDNVTVTNARFIVDSQTFAMSNITSVKSSEVAPSRFLPVLLMLIGLLILVGGASVWALAFIGGGVLWLLTQHTVFHVMLTTAGGETSALKSNQREYVQQVVQALNDAIVARG